MWYVEEQSCKLCDRKARLASLVRVLEMNVCAWVLLVEERIDGGMYW